jgi:hypothetical protein
MTEIINERGARFYALEKKGERMCKRNMGTVERTVRIVAGVALLSLTFIGPQTPWGWIGVVPLLTGLIGVCPLYRICGMSSGKCD